MTGSKLRRATLAIVPLVVIGVWAGTAAADEPAPDQPTLVDTTADVPVGAGVVDGVIVAVGLPPVPPAMVAEPPIDELIAEPLATAVVDGVLVGVAQAPLPPSTVDVTMPPVPSTTVVVPAEQETTVEPAPQPVAGNVTVGLLFAAWG